ncbi:hypothetical protein PIROE2DRAFT_63384 [Piromyces sp. E2]|nr:hypothetical protein PIROE2DRAFT_63384 [Piromyces sp. E2]|eukprot:OUM60032.1 hypothetical protein PIROE2DRAFT_63384 [Piromyces sp. E2]
MDSELSDIDFELSEIDFLNSSLYEIRCFAESVNEGDVKEYQVKEIFEKVKLKKYTEEEAKYLVFNIIFAFFVVPKIRVDFQVYSNEALLYVLNFINIEGSSNLKILYSLFSCIIVTEEDEDNNKRYSFSYGIPREIKIDFYDRLYYLRYMDLNIYYVGNANFTILKNNENALVYDCGTANLVSFLEEKLISFNIPFEAYLSNIFKGVENILVVISHLDEDHKNLLKLLKILIEKINRSIMSKCNDTDTVKNLICIEGIVEGNKICVEEYKMGLDSFFTSNRFFLNSRKENNFSNIEIKALVPPQSEISNENSIVLKIILNFYNKETCSILLTGDASKRTLENFIEKYYRNIEEGLRDIFSDVILHLIPHHGSITNDSFVWSENVIKRSKYPAINIISFNPYLKNGKPQYQFIKNFVKNYEKKIENLGEYYKIFYCIPHYIRCNYKSKIMEYPSYNNGIEMPLFVTYCSYSDGFRIKFNPYGITLTDDIKIFEKNKINIPLYEFKLNNEFYDKKLLNEMYSFHLSYRLLKISNDIYNSLSHKIIKKEEITLKNGDKIKNDVTEYINKIERYLILNDICKGNCNKTENSFKEITNINNIEMLKNYALKLKQILKREESNNKYKKCEINDKKMSHKNNKNNNEIIKRKKCIEDLKKYLSIYFKNNDDVISKIEEIFVVTDDEEDIKNNFKKIKLFP